MVGAGNLITGGRLRTHAFDVDVINGVAEEASTYVCFVGYGMQAGI
jgi:hypothetical protein